MATSQFPEFSYEETVEKLNSLIHKSEDSSVKGAPVSWEEVFANSRKHLQILELEEALDRLNVIHVAGTKGKGSTCAFCESMLRESGFKTGLFTSPHLLDVRERFRIDGEEVSKQLFVENFWIVYNRLKEKEYIVQMPGFFRFMFLLSVQLFSIEKVDVAIMEVGIGGDFDATNVVRTPAVTGVASLGFDHCDLLGYTMASIARAKAGIFKPGVPAFTAPQVDEAMDVLRARAGELKIPVTVVPPLESYGAPNLRLGLSGDHQRLNAALAVALCKSWSERTGNVEHWQKARENGGLPDTYISGLAKTRWPGRGEIVDDFSNSCSKQDLLNDGHARFGRLQFFLDGAHSPESMEACGKWFCDAAKDSAKRMDSQEYLTDSADHEQNHRFQRVLLFGCMPRRDPSALLPPLINVCTQQGLPVDLALFAPQSSSYVSLTMGDNKVDVSWQLKLQNLWESLRRTRTEALASNGVASPASGGVRYLLRTLDLNKGGCKSVGASSAVMSSLPETLTWLRSCSRQHPKLHIQVLVTGSLYLVGDMLKLLRH